MTACRGQPKRKLAVWIGGGPWPAGGREYNLSNDVAAAYVVMGSGMAVWQIPSPVYRTMRVGYAELAEKVYPCGRIGRYLIEQLIEFNARTQAAVMEYRLLGDSPVAA